jgi:hypothetical protein
MPLREVVFLNTWSGRVIARLSSIFPSLSSAQHQHEHSYDKLLDRLRNFVRRTKSPYKYCVETDEHIHKEKVLSFDLPGGGKASVLKIRVRQVPTNGERPLLGLTFHHDWQGMLVAAAVEAYVAMNVARGARMGIMSVEHGEDGLPKWTIEKEGGEYVAVEIVARVLLGDLDGGAAVRDELENVDVERIETRSQNDGAGGGETAAKETVTQL